jgi:phosphate transport system permease protein
MFETPTTGNPSAQAAAIRQQMHAAAPRIALLKRIDRAAVGIITAGGVAVVLSVLGILVFIAAEAMPLFRGATYRLEGAAPIAREARPTSAAASVIGSDEYQRYLYTILPDATIAVLDAQTGARVKALPVPGLDDARVTAVSRSAAADCIALGTDDGRAALTQLRFLPLYSESGLWRIDVELRLHRIVQIDRAQRPIRRLSYVESDRAAVAAQVGDREIVFWWMDADGTERHGMATVGAGEQISQLRVGRNAAVIAGTDRGTVYRWELDEDVTEAGIARTGREPVTALEWVLGDTSFIAGTAAGQLTGWFPAPLDDGNRLALVRGHVFPPRGGAVTAIAVSARDRSFASAADDGSIVLHHFTSERTLLRIPSRGPVEALSLAPRGDGLLALRAGGVVDRYRLVNPHPEVGLSALFGKIWYEGYPAPAYVWQSTGATDEFESKFSLVPLLFGTIKGTLYAMLFATPLAVLGALYTSQFAHRRIRAKVKAWVEIMAAVPSVVIGFLAGLYLAGVVERNLVGVILMVIGLPLCGTSGVLLWRVLPGAIRRNMPTGIEILVIPPLLVAGGWLALQAGPAIETWLFAADARQWLGAAVGITYDQRNSLIVGLAMGLAVIPIIFTISEDAFSSVPGDLTAASLALGATPWQSAVRVVVPTASPGVFSAVMVGFGRAVGETMIVLMATGNTPIIDWSILNGFRSLSANIAVEIPEAPYGATLYRTLFLSGALLFILTFAVNTAAEVIRQRLRRTYRAV